MATIAIGSVTFPTDGAWGIEDPLPLLARANNVGPNLTVSDADGVTRRDKQRGSLRIPLRVFIFGLKDSAGSAHADEFKGVSDNYDHLYTNLVAATKTASVTCTVTFDDASTKSGSVEVPQLQMSSHNGPKSTTAVAAMEVVLLDGQLT